jgi:hypothetical protein
MFCWDVAFGWHHRHETREIARRGREEVERAAIERSIREEEAEEAARREAERGMISPNEPALMRTMSPATLPDVHDNEDSSDRDETSEKSTPPGELSSTPAVIVSENDTGPTPGPSPGLDSSIAMLVPPSTSATGAADEKQADTSADYLPPGMIDEKSIGDVDEKNRILSERIAKAIARRQEPKRKTLVSISISRYRWLQETFPTVMAVVMHLPFALVPFAFAMFVLVQALVTKGWVSVFAHGWDHWVNRTGTVGSIGGMGFVSVILCNVSFST